MADVSETQILLRQIKYLTDLINNAKKKEENFEQCKPSEHALTKQQQTGIQYGGQTMYPESCLEKSSQSYSSHNDLSTKSQVQAHSSGRYQHTGKDISQQTHNSLLKSHRIGGDSAQAGKGPSKTQTAKSLQNLLISRKESPANVSENCRSKTIDRKTEDEYASTKDNHLSSKKAEEVSIAREKMKNKIEDLKASIAQLSAAKKQTKVLEQDEARRQVRQVVKRSNSVGFHSEENKMKEEKQETQDVKTENKEEKLSDNLAISCPSHTASGVGGTLRKAETLQVPSCSSSAITKNALSEVVKIQKCEDVHKSCMASVDAGQPQTTASKSLCHSKSGKGAETRQRDTDKGSGMHIGTSSKSSTVAELQRELLETEKKLHCMRQKIGCMLKESPVKAVPSQSSRTVLLSSRTETAVTNSGLLDSMSLSKTDAQISLPSAKGKVCHSPSWQEGPFPNRKSLKWTPQKNSASSPEMVLVVSTSPSLRSCMGKSAKVTETTQEATAGAKQPSSAAAAAHKSVLNKPQPGTTDACVSPKEIAPSTPGKVQTTRCMFGKYSLRIVKTGASSPSLRSCMGKSSKVAETKQEATTGEKRSSVAAHKSVLNKPQYGKTSARVSTKEASSAPSTSSTPGKVQTTRCMFGKYSLRIHKTGISSPREPGDVTTSASAVLSTPVQINRPTPGKVQTTRCMFGKYSLRIVETGVSSPREPGDMKTSTVKTRYKVIQNAKLGSQAGVPKNAEPRSMAQRAAKVVVSKYKMQQVPPSVLRHTNYGTYQRQRPLYTSHSFMGKTYFNYGHPSWRQGRGSQALYRGKQRIPYYGSPSSWWRNMQDRQLQYLHATACMRRRAARALKLGMTWSRSHPSSRYNRQTVITQQQQLQKRLRLIKKYKLVRQRSTQDQLNPSPSKSGREHQDHLLMINGILYRSSSTCLTKASKSVSPAATLHQSPAIIVKNVSKKKMQTVTVRGVQFRVDGQGTRLQRVESSSSKQANATISRVDIGGTTYIQTREGTLEKVFDNQTKSVINRVKQRSIARVAAKFKKDNTKEKKKLCLFYSRFGKCSRGDKCPYAHDPDKIAVCTRFLRGTCKVEQCPFSHKVAKEKMPVCAFFLRGVCAREDCPYLHVKVNQGAEICQDFVSGYCALADKCKKLHTLTCPSFSKTGTCPDGKKCRLQHKRDIVSKNKKSQSTEALSKSVAPSTRPAVKRRWSAEGHEEEGESAAVDGEVPRKLPRLPAFISLADYSTDESPAQTPSRPVKAKSVPNHTGSSLQIKPRI